MNILIKEKLSYIHGFINGLIEGTTSSKMQDTLQSLIKYLEELEALIKGEKE